MQVATSEPRGLGDPGPKNEVRQIIDNSDLVVGLVSDASSRWTQLELKLAESLGRPVALVQLGDTSDSPVSSQFTFHLSDDAREDEIENAANEIMSSLAMVRSSGGPPPQ